MKDTIKKIYRHLLLNKVYLKDPGLYFGKTGCLIFFAHYANLYEDNVHDEIVSEMIDEIFEDVNSIHKLDIRNGLCGIGWGVEYILQNRLMEGDSDEILADLDSIILDRGTRFISSQNDFADVLHYVVVRLTSLSGGRKETPFPYDYLRGLSDIAQKNDDPIIRRNAKAIGKALQTGRRRNKPIVLTNDMLGEVAFEKFPFVPPGLNHGLSGLGIRLINDPHVHSM